MKRKYMKVSILLLLIATGTTAYSQEMPQFTSDQEKEAWIKANPALYEQKLNESRANVVKTETVSVKQTERLAERTVGAPQYALISDLPGFPVLQRTGNPDADLQRYNTEKAKFYEENRDLINEINEKNARLNPVTKPTNN